MIKEIHFENFRCFKEFSLKNLSQISVISGKNNVGKTTILEGIYLLLAFQRGDVLFNLDGFRGIDFPVGQLLTNNIRGAIIEPLNLWETLFYNMAKDISIKIDLYFSDHKKRMITFKQDDNASLTSIPAYTTMQPVTNNAFEHNILKFEYIEDYSKLAQGYFIINGVSLAHQIDKKFTKPNLPFVTYFGPNILISQQTIAEWLGIIERNNKKDKLINFLSELIRDIKDIFVVNQKNSLDIFCRLADGQSFPIRTMGDGINKLLNYITGIAANPNGIFLIDEIENGFHYSFYPKLCQILSQIIFQYNSQLIITTHSREFIEAANINISKIYNKLFNYIRLDNINGEICTTPYSDYDLDFALDHNMEVR